MNKNAYSSSSRSILRLSLLLGPRSPACANGVLFFFFCFFPPLGPIPGTRPLFALITRSARSSSSRAFCSSALSKASLALRYKTPNVITASNATAIVNPMVVKMFGACTPSESISTASEGSTVASWTRAAVTTNVTDTLGTLGLSVTVEFSVSHATRFAAERTITSLAREKITLALFTAVGATLRRTEPGDRVAVILARRDVHARTATHARIGSGCRTEAIEDRLCDRKNVAVKLEEILISHHVLEGCPDCATIVGTASRRTPAMMGSSPRAAVLRVGEDTSADDDAAASARAAGRAYLERALDDAVTASSAQWAKERSNLLHERAEVESRADELAAKVSVLESENASLKEQLHEAEQAGALAVAEQRKTRAELEERLDDDDVRVQKAQGQCKVWEDACVKYRKRLEHAERSLAKLKTKVNAAGFVEATQDVYGRIDEGDVRGRGHEFERVPQNNVDSPLALLPLPALAPVARKRQREAINKAVNLNTFQGLQELKPPNGTFQDLKQHRDDDAAYARTENEKEKSVSRVGGTTNRPQHALQTGTFNGWRRNKAPVTGNHGVMRRDDWIDEGGLGDGNRERKTEGGGLEGNDLREGNNLLGESPTADVFPNDADTNNGRSGFDFIPRTDPRVDPRNASDRDLFTIGGGNKVFKPNANAMPPPSTNQPSTPRVEKNVQPEPSAEKEIKRVEVERNKFAREKLPAWKCEECEKFYAATGRPVPQLKQGEACQHCPGPSKVNDWSRHRAKWAPPPAPAGFWNLDLTPAPRR